MSPVRPGFICWEIGELIFRCVHVHFTTFSTENGTVAVAACVPIHSARGAEFAQRVAEVCLVVFATGPTGVEHHRAGVGKVSPLLALQAADQFTFALDNVESPLAYHNAFNYDVICRFRVGNTGCRVHYYSL